MKVKILLGKRIKAKVVTIKDFNLNVFINGFNE